MAAALLVAFFIATTVWWLSENHRVPDFDTGKHLLFALAFRDQLASGDLTGPFTAFTSYPPLAHIVGALGALIGGVSVWAPILALNVVFVPVLAWALYSTGRELSAPRAGLYAVVFALGAPMCVTLFHSFFLEAPATALVAAAVYLLIRSERFARPDFAAAAGLAVGLGVLSKQTFPFFVAGFLALLVVRGGWRRWKGLLIFAAVGVAVGAPWYLAHLHELHSSLAYATVPPKPPRWSTTNAAWFSWDQVNYQLFLPLALLAAGGAVYSLMRFVRERGPNDYVPELVAGAVGSYVCVTLLMGQHAPYYSLPMLPYEALLGTLWMSQVRGAPAWAAPVGLGAVCAMNFLAVSVIGGRALRIDLPGPKSMNAPEARRLTLYGGESWPVGPPRDGGNLLRVFNAARRDGIKQAEFDPATDLGFFNPTGLTALARVAGLSRPPAYNPSRLGNDAIFVTRQQPAADIKPCATLQDGSVVLISRGNPFKPLSQYTYCP